MRYAMPGAALPLLLCLPAVTTSASESLSRAPSVWLIHEGHAGATPASGVLNNVDAAQRKVNVSHGSIKQLGWPAMTMDFPVGSGVDLAGIKPGMKVTFTLVRGSGGAWTIDTLKASTK